MVNVRNLYITALSINNMCHNQSAKNGQTILHNDLGVPALQTRPFPIWRTLSRKKTGFATHNMLFIFQMNCCFLAQQVLHRLPFQVVNSWRYWVERKACLASSYQLCQCMWVHAQATSALLSKRGPHLQVNNWKVVTSLRAMCWSARKHFKILQTEKLRGHALPCNRISQPHVPYLQPEWIASRKAHGMPQCFLMDLQRGTSNKLLQNAEQHKIETSRRVHTI